MGLFNKAAFFINLVTYRLMGKRIPLSVIINVTDRCNLKCSYCYASYYNRRKEELSLEQIQKIVDELAGMGCKRISLGGGEPLVRKDIGDIINYIKKKGISCTVNSNGVLVPEKIELIKKADVLCLSLDGDEKAHESFRGKGSFNMVIEAIECAKSHKIPLVTNTVLHKNNLGSIEFILNLARKHGFLAEFNISISHLEKSDEDPHYEGSDDSVKEALGKLIEYKKKGYPVLFSRKALEYSLSWPSYEIDAIYDNPPDFKYAKCTAGKYFCIIDTNGLLYPCPHLIGKFNAVNVKEDGFKRAFEGLDCHNCKACYQVYHNEFNLLFNLDKDVIFNYIKSSLTSHK